MVPDFLSNVELYFSSQSIRNNLIEITGEESHHIKNVMRHQTGDNLYVTNGKGSIYQTTIETIDTKKIVCSILEEKVYPNPLSRITFCIPRLRTADRFEFALEKCVELGITNFIVFDSKHSVAKGEKIDRWQKILTSAMKQSLRAWLPKISYVKSVEELSKLSDIKILFDQNSKQNFSEFIPTLNSKLETQNFFFIFGPEGGFSKEELRIANGELKIKLIDNRLRSETAIVTAAAMLALSIRS